jgi:DNA mismatch repair protein MutS2
MFRTYYSNAFSSKLLWIALLQTCIRDIIDRQHYTVNMILAVAVTTAAWGWTRGIYPEDEPLPASRDDKEGGKPTAAALLLVVLGLATAVVAVFVAKS